MSRRPSSLPRRRPPRLALRKDRMGMVSRARLGVRRGYRDDVRLDSCYAKTGWEWCHVLVSASVVATATTSASTRVTLRQVGMVSRARLGVRRRYRDDVRLDSRYAKTGWQWCHVLVSASVIATATTSASTRVTLRQGGTGVTCSSRRPSSLPRRRPPRLALS